ncbi:MAG: type II toxin-antitoxin system ParD family antitoxin [Acidobacteria bacterium]|nr:type II toxin-antitoxin system ParD family antitoxin [Acidobacteriota bacterium]
MPTINISLNEGLKTFVEQRISKSGYSTASEYFRELVRADQKRDAETRLEALLLEGIESGEPTAMTPADWNDIRKEVKRRATQRKKEKAKK